MWFTSRKTRRNGPRRSFHNASLLQLERLEERALLATFTVVNTDDSGAGSLRQTIVGANGDSGTDTISFARAANDANHVYYKNDRVAGQVTLTQRTTTTASDDTAIADIDPDWAHSWWSIKPTSTLPIISDTVVINGYSQPGAQADGGQRANWQKTGIDAVLRIELDGSSMQVGQVLSGLIIATGNGTLADSGSTVQGLVINRFVDNASGNDFGIHLTAGGGNQIQGNFIGTDVSGTLAPSGPVDMSANLAPSSGMHVGVFVGQGSRNNRIGTDGDGVNDAAERNILSAMSAGVGISGVDSGRDNVVAGNFIGTDRTGTEPLRNWLGIALQSGTTGNRIGTNGTGPDIAGERNIISGNKFGIGPGSPMPSSSETLVAGNFIGTDVTGTQPLGNLVAGIAATLGISNWTIGGATSALANIIAFNQGPGVWVFDASQLPGNPVGIRVQGNSIYDNSGLGIEIGGDYLFAPPTGANFDGVMPNDPSDADTGPNNLQNFPVITSAVFTPTTSVVSGSLQSTPSGSFVLDFYASPAADASGYGEGKYYLRPSVIGSTTVTTNSSGDATFTNITLTTPTIQGDVVRVITATATDAAGNTSEFSQAFTFDIDGDGIADTVDTQPLTFSNDFSDGTTTGTIANRGNQHITIADALNPAEGVLIAADSLGGLTPATISVPNGTLFLTAGDQVIVTQGSVILNVLAGTVEATFVANSGQVATTSLAAGNGLTFQPESFTFVAPATNTQTVQVLVNGLELNVQPGQTVKSVQIDIKPGSYPNTINVGSHGSVPVAIFSTATFNATTVDPLTVTLAGAAVRLRGNGTPQASQQDVNGDGRLDLVVHVAIEALQLTAGDVQAVLDGRTFDGLRVVGSDSVRIVNGLHVAEAGPGSSVAVLTLSEAEAMAWHALARWATAGVHASMLSNIDIRIADLGGDLLGMADGNTIYLDDNAAGWGWFADATPGDDSEFTTLRDQGELNRMDLLTVVMHELGHVLGRDHDDDGVMAETLAAGVRRTDLEHDHAELLPARDQFFGWLATMFEEDEQIGKKMTRTRLGQ